MSTPAAADLFAQHYFSAVSSGVHRSLTGWGEVWIECRQLAEYLAELDGILDVMRTAGGLLDGESCEVCNPKEPGSGDC